MCSCVRAEKFGLYAGKMKEVTTMKGFGKALDLRFKWKFPAKEDAVSCMLDR